MKSLKISKMGELRIVILPSTDYEYGDIVLIKPKGIDYKMMGRVTKSGDRKMVIIPKRCWSVFEHRGEVYVRKWEKAKM
jgi:hypothetical protein